MTDVEYKLIAEQLRHTIDLLRAEISTLRTTIDHDRKFISHRLDTLEGIYEDHETRIRSATAGVTQFKVWSGLASGGSSLMSLVALIKAFFGG